MTPYNYPMVNISDLEIGDRAKIVGYKKSQGSSKYRKELLDMGLIKGTEFVLIRKAPLGDPITISIRNYELSLRKNEVEKILKIEKISSCDKPR